MRIINIARIEMLAGELHFLKVLLVSALVHPREMHIRPSRISGPFFLFNGTFLALNFPHLELVSICLVDINAYPCYLKVVGS